MAAGSTESTARYVSPDGLLTFLVIRYPDDIVLGFDGFPSHKHGDIIASLSGLPEDEAVQQYVDALLNSQSIIAVHAVEGRLRDIWVYDDPLRPTLGRYRPKEGALTFRLWDGTPATPRNAE